jgi:glutamine synthetase
MMRSREEFYQLIEDEDIEFIRLQFTDVFGNLKNIAVTPGQLSRVLDNKYSFEGPALFDNMYDYANDLYLKPDLDTFVILPWRPQQGKVGKIICDVVNSDGSPCELSPRTILKNIVEEAAKVGYEFNINPECEFFLFHTDDNGNPTTVSHEKAGYLDVGPVDFGENARRDMVLTLEEMGFEIESSHHEQAPAQHEIDFAEGESLATADAVMTFKFAVRSIAKRFGLYATFMPKPRTDEAGSGMHLKFTLLKDGKNVFDCKEGMSDMASYFIGGIMEHAQAMCAITNPIVNSYKRIFNIFFYTSKFYSYSNYYSRTKRKELFKHMTKR